MRIATFTAAALIASGVPANAAMVDDATAVKSAMPEAVVVADDLSATERAKILKPVEAFYGFWTNGSQALLDAAVSPRFIDHTLPPGRPQGPGGPATAARTFLAAVPDLKVAVLQRIVVKDRVVSQLRFTGHFTGRFQDIQGRGQPVHFIATDILKVTHGAITDNWHIEDNLTFLSQIGAIPGHSAR